MKAHPSTKKAQKNDHSPARIDLEEALKGYPEPRQDYGDHQRTEAFSFACYFSEGICCTTGYGWLQRIHQEGGRVEHSARVRYRDW